MDKAFGQITSALTAMGLRKQISLLVVTALVVAGFIYLINYSGRPQFQNLYSNLAPADAGQIIERLKDQKVPYQLTGGGTCIQVPEEKVYEIRMALASEGLPQGSGIGFEVFDNAKLGMTEFMQNVNYQRALQGELARTINQIDEIESARVHIVMPAKSLFIEEEKPSSASVVLKLKPGRALAAQQIQGIVHLISSSVSGLATEHVTVVDNRGKLLAGNSEPESTAALSTDQFMFQRKMESSLESRVKTMLEEVLGPSKAIVRVSCDMDFTRHEQTEEMYLPDNQVVRSEQIHDESAGRSSSPAMGVPGVRANMLTGSIGTDLPTADTTISGIPSVMRKQDLTKNYEIGKVVSRKVMPFGSLRRVSAAVVVDGNYTEVTKKKGKSEWQYAPRSSEEMAQLALIVKSAINFDGQRGDTVEIQNIPFENGALAGGDAAPPAPSWVEDLRRFKFIFDFLLMGLFVIMGFLFMVRPLIRWLTSSGGRSEIVRQLPKTVNELEREYGGKRLPFSDQVRQMITSDNQNSVGLVREWIKE